jgi:hypothetical protein
MPGLRPGVKTIRRQRVIGDQLQRIGAKLDILAKVDL